MNKKLKKTISLILCMIMLFGAAPLSGIAELDFSKLNIFSGLHLPKLSLPEFDLPFGMKASAVNSYGSFSYVIQNDYVRITKCDKEVTGKVIIPSRIDDYSVRVISD